MKFLNGIVIVSKRKIGKLFTVFGVIAMLLSGACTGLDRLSNDTGLGGFVVDTVFTAGLQMDEPQIVDSQRTPISCFRHLLARIMERRKS